jgi:hypothetical protein
MASRRPGGDACAMPGVEEHEVPLSSSPADRARGRRGWRAPVACLAALAALAVVVASEAVVSGSWSNSRAAVDYTLDGPGWTGPAMVAAAIALAAASALIWAARRTLLLVLGLVVLACALTGAVLAHLERRDAGRVTAAAVKDIAIGTPRDEVTDVLGSPAGHGTMTRRGGRLECLVYVQELRRGSDLSRERYLCFRDGRLAYREDI